MKAAFIAPAFIGSAFAAVAVRDPNSPCTPNGKSTAPEPVVNTLAGFNEDAGYTMVAWKAETPTGYESTLTNGNCALDSPKYMLYSKLKSYDVQACADICDHHHGCDAFNIYIQREPGMIPGPGCPNPKAIFTTICALYSEPVSTSKCTNAGQYIGLQDVNGEAFKTAVRASNVYARLPAKEAVKVVTTTRNIFYDKQSLRIQTLYPPQTATAKETDTVVSKPTSLQSIPTAVSTPEIPASVIDEINSRVSKMLYITTGTDPVSSPWVQIALTPLPPGAVIPLISQSSSINQVAPATTEAASLLSAPAAMVSMALSTQQAPSVTQVGAATTEVANTPQIPTTVSAAVLLGTPFIQQVNTPIIEAVNTSAPAASVAAVSPIAPSAGLVNTTATILQSKLATLLTAVIPQASAIIQNTTTAVNQSSAPTANPTTPVVGASLPVEKRCHKGGVWCRPFRFRERKA